MHEKKKNGQLNKSSNRLSSTPIRNHPHTFFVLTAHKSVYLNSNDCKHTCLKEEGGGYSRELS